MFFTYCEYIHNYYIGITSHLGCLGVHGAMKVLAKLLPNFKIRSYVGLYSLLR